MFNLEMAQFEYEIMEATDECFTNNALCEIMYMEGVTDDIKKIVTNVVEAIRKIFMAAIDVIVGIKDKIVNTIRSKIAEIKRNKVIDAVKKGLISNDIQPPLSVIDLELAMKEFKYQVDMIEKAFNKFDKAENSKEMSFILSDINQRLDILQNDSIPTNQYATKKLRLSIRNVVDAYNWLDRIDDKVEKYNEMHQKELKALAEKAEAIARKKAEKMNEAGNSVVNFFSGACKTLTNTSKGFFVSVAKVAGIVAASIIGISVGSKIAGKVTSRIE